MYALPSKTLKILLFALLCQFPQWILGQSIAIEGRIYNEENGLSRYANFTHKDSRGIIWIGTQYGLYRFDGEGFTAFNEHSGLPFRQIMEIYEDEEGWFWLYKSCWHKPSCQRDLAFFHPLTKQVLSFDERFGDQLSVRADQIIDIAQDSANIYFTANNKFISWSAEKGIREVELKGLSQTPILLAKVNEQLFTAFYVEDSARLEGVDAKQQFRFVAFDQDGNLKQAPQTIDMAGLTIRELLKINHFAFRLDHFRFGAYQWTINATGGIEVDTLPYSMPMYADIDWPLYLDGQLLANEKGEMVHRELGRINNLETTYAFESQEKHVNNNRSMILWAKTRMQGGIDGDSLYMKILSQVSTMRHYFFDPDTKITWSAESRGIFSFQFKTLNFRYALNNWPSQLAVHIAPLDEDRFLMLPLQGVGIVYNRLTQQSRILSAFQKSYLPKSSVEDKENGLIWGMNSNNVLKINKKDLSIVAYPVVGFSKRSVLVYKSGSYLWGAKNRGLSFFDTESKTIADVAPIRGLEALDTVRVHFVKPFHDRLFIGTDNGLFIRNEKEGSLIQLGNMESADAYLSAKRIFDMSEAKDGGYWLATFSGLVHLDGDVIANVRQGKAVNYQQYSTKNGLLTNELFAAYEDDYGFVWMPTPHGLIQFQISTHASKAYQESDGLTNSGFQEYAHQKMADGTLMLGGYQGFNIFHPKDFKDVAFHPKVPLIITEYEQFDHRTEQLENKLPALVQEQKIVLQPGDKLFNIRLALSDYRAAEQHRFAYKIEGYEEVWNEDKSNYIRISGLPYGDFTLRIKGRLADGQYTQPELAIPILVQRPFYLQWGFMALCLVLFLGTLFYWYQRRTQALRNKQAELEQAVRVATETIRLKNEKLENLDKIKSRFFANVSHELRTPLTLILGPLSTMMKSHQLDNKNFTLARMVRQNSQHLLRLVNEILDLTKLDSDKMEVREDNVRLYDIVRRILSAFESHAQRQGIHFELESKVDKYLQLRLDKDKFEKILNNLLSNAFKFTPRNGRIEVRVEDLANHIQLTIKDTGRGIHPDDMPHVFNRFYQSALPNAPTEGGSGIGLSLCKELVKLMKGELWAESTWGEGSCFYFKFPKVEVFGFSEDQLPEDLPALVQKDIPVETIAKVGTHRMEQEMEAIPENGKKPTILIVEDNHSLRDYLKLTLQGYCEVRAAENGQVAWEALTVNPNGLRQPDLIISDIMMPEMDGYQLLDKLKTHPAFGDTPIIMLTARAAMEDKLKALRIGVDDYMLKPFEQEELLARVDNLLRHARQRRQPVELAETEAQMEDSFLSEEDREWQKNLEQTVLDRLTNFDFSVTDLAQAMATNRWQLNTRIKQLTGLTSNHYIQEVRLNHARQLLESGQLKTVKQVAYEIGMKDIKYFSRQFKKRFGKSPSAYL